MSRIIEFIEECEMEFTRICGIYHRHYFRYDKVSYLEKASYYAQLANRCREWRIG